MLTYIDTLIDTASFKVIPQHLLKKVRCICFLNYLVPAIFHIHWQQTHPDEVHSAHMLNNFGSKFLWSQLPTWLLPCEGWQSQTSKPEHWGHSTFPTCDFVSPQGSWACLSSLSSPRPLFSFRLFAGGPLGTPLWIVTYVLQSVILSLTLAYRDSFTNLLCVFPHSSHIFFLNLQVIEILSL